MDTSSPIPAPPVPATADLAAMVRASSLANVAGQLGCSTHRVRKELQADGYTDAGHDRLASTAARLGEGDRLGGRPHLQPGELTPVDPDPFRFPSFDPQPWAAGAVCGQTDPEAFFPTVGSRSDAAKALCMGCDVREECLEYALRNGMEFGIWGGLSFTERRALSGAEQEAA